MGLVGDTYDHAMGAARARRITPIIPRRQNSRERGRFFPKRLYKIRARIEQTSPAAALRWLGSIPRRLRRCPAGRTTPPMPSRNEAAQRRQQLPLRQSGARRAAKQQRRPCVYPDDT